MYRISVRMLVEFLLRKGDIVSGGFGRKNVESMLAGGRIHRKIQKRQPGTYRAEVPLSRVVERDGYVLFVEGRADGIQEDVYEETKAADGTIVENRRCLIDEIKGTYREIELMEEPEELHLAQAKCYAAIYGKDEGYEVIDVQITYAHLETEEIRKFRQTYRVDELSRWFESLVLSYCKWTDLAYRRLAERNASIEKLEFPFAYREGQKSLAAAVYHSIKDKKRLFIQAPTGVGKTISVLFPAVKVLGEGHGDRIFYLTAKTVTSKAASDAFRAMDEKGLKMSRIYLTAKEKLCLCDEKNCDPDICPYAKGHYDRINDAVFAFFTDIYEGSRETVTEYAKKYKVCPFEFSLDAALWMDAVVGDYNYAFSPTVKLKRFFVENTGGKAVFLIDEAHNLVERGREMFSASICKEDVLEIKRLAKPFSRSIVRSLEKCNKYLLERKRECEDVTYLTDVDEFLLCLLQAEGSISRYLENPPVIHPDGNDEEFREKLLDFYFQVLAFLDTAERLDENYLIETHHGAENRFYLNLMCINPSGDLRKCLDTGAGAVLFSATMLPINYYKELLTGDVEDPAIYANSPFDTGKRKLLIASDVSSRYRDRGDIQYRRVAEYIRTVTKKKNGNYMVFFPSYQYMNEVLEYFDEGNLHVQKMGMTEDQRKEFLEAFSEENEESVIGFCVMGGIFSEGIDLRGESLIGVIIVGTGLPKVCREREILKSYFDRHGKSGYDFAYLYPGMNKVQQAAGRVIRTEEDLGVIALLDDRFLQNAYRRTFPREWYDYDVCSRETAGKIIEDFWMDKEEK